MTSGDDARLLNFDEVIGTFRQKFRQAIDPSSLITIVSKAGGEAVPESIMS
jgi:hypothetical protein